jgi:hypothetical protein
MGTIDWKCPAPQVTFPFSILKFLPAVLLQRACGTISVVFHNTDVPQDHNRYIADFSVTCKMWSSLCITQTGIPLGPINPLRRIPPFSDGKTDVSLGTLFIEGLDFFYLERCPSLLMAISERWQGDRAFLSPVSLLSVTETRGKVWISERGHVFF